MGFIFGKIGLIALKDHYIPSKRHLDIAFCHVWNKRRRLRQPPPLLLPEVSAAAVSAPGGTVVSDVVAAFQNRPLVSPAPWSATLLLPLLPPARLWPVSPTSRELTYTSGTIF
jgi:hypothetical protein